MIQSTGLRLWVDTKGRKKKTKGRKRGRRHSGGLMMYGWMEASKIPRRGVGRGRDGWNGMHWNGMDWIGHVSACSVYEYCISYSRVGRRAGLLAVCLARCRRWDGWITVHMRIWGLGWLRGNGWLIWFVFAKLFPFFSSFSFL